MRDKNPGEGVSKSESKSKPAGITRRSAVKMGAAGIVGSAFTGQVSAASAEYCGTCDPGYDPEFTRSFDVRVVSYDQALESYEATNVVVIAHRVDSREIGSQVMHQFLAGGVAFAEEERPLTDWEEMENIAELKIEMETGNPTTSSVFPPGSDDERAIAATQEDGSQPDDRLDWEEGLIAAADEGASEISDRANVFLSAYNIYSAFRNDGESENEGNHAEYTWDYSGGWFGNNYRASAGAAVRFYIEDDDPANGYDMSAYADITRDKPKETIVSEDDNEYIRQRIYSGSDVTVNRHEPTSVAEVDDPVVKRKAREEGVDEIRKISYNDQSDSGIVK